MNETKQFPARVLLTVTTGRLLTKPQGPDDNGISDLYQLLGWMTNDSPFTHQLGRFGKECRPWLLRWFPELEKVDLQALDTLIVEHGAEAGVEQWLEDFVRVLGGKTAYDVPRIPMDDHDRKDPFTELVAELGADKTIVVLKVPENK